MKHLMSFFVASDKLLVLRWLEELKHLLSVENEVEVKNRTATMFTIRALVVMVFVVISTLAFCHGFKYLHSQ